jgi:hypothetical protein
MPLFCPASAEARSIARPCIFSFHGEVGMQLFRQAAIGLLDFLLGKVPLDSQILVWIGGQRILLFEARSGGRHGPAVQFITAGEQARSLTPPENLCCPCWVDYKIRRCLLATAPKGPRLRHIPAPLPGPGLAAQRRFQLDRAICCLEGGWPSSGIKARKAARKTRPRGRVLFCGSGSKWLNIWRRSDLDRTCRTCS